MVESITNKYLQNFKSKQKIKLVEPTVVRPRSIQLTNSK